jgi:hypothetical protein
MKVERLKFKAQFQEFPKWGCPTCCKGNLQQIEGALKKIQTGPSERSFHLDEWEPDWIEERFCNFLKCDNTSCGDVCSISGSTSNFLAQYYDEHEGLVDPELITSFHPKSLSPSPHVFYIHPKVPDILRDTLLESFDLLWANHAACANKLRTALELLLDDLKIPRKAKRKNGSEFNLTLHHRIEEYAKISPEISKLLLAVKWLGNNGSHAESGNLDREDLLNAFELVEYALDDSYSGQRKRLAAIADAINKAKGKS